MSVRITVTSQKGGVGKTTVCLNLAVAFAERGWRTLIVDLDPQGAIALALRKGSREWAGVTEALVGVVDVSEAVVKTSEPRLSILSRGRLDPVDVPMFETLVGESDTLESLLSEAEQGFDVVLIDTPAGVGLIPRAALTVSGYALVPFEAGPLTMRSVGQTLRVVEHARQHENESLRLLGILATMVRLTEDPSHTAIMELWSGFEGVLDTMIPHSDLFTQAHHIGTPIDYLPGATTPEARRFGHLAAELEDRIPELTRTEQNERPQRTLV